jgi:5-methylcytosine-specific restriction endonuclease McrA
MTEYCFVQDYNGKQLSPTKINKGWYLIRKQRAALVLKYPMVIRLKKEVPDEEQDTSKFIVGIDDGSKSVGIAIVQKCKTKNKVVFKGTIEQRQDVRHLMDVRRGYRRYHRQHKRYRKARFDNCASSKREGRLAPSIKQKKDAVLRVVNRLEKWCPINKIILEDVQIDIRALQDGKLYSWQYQKSNRLDENLRMATLIRDKYTCQECGKKNCELQAHHIVPRRSYGNNSTYNLITLCKKCHDKTKGCEEKFIEKYQEKIKGKNINFSDAMHVMQGKTYLRQALNDIAPLKLTVGSETANKRIDWGIEKSHSNDAIVITGLRPDTCNIKKWTIKPMRRQSKAKGVEVEGFRHRDFVSYTDSKNIIYRGYVTALYTDKKQMNIQSPEKHLKRCGYKRCKLLERFEKIYWLCA